MDVTGRFAEAVRRPEPDVPLDLVAFLVAAHAYPGLDVEGQLARLDELAAGCGGSTVADVASLLFEDLRFAGNDGDYYDPRNSYLNNVLDRRTGIPIALSLLTMEVARRVGVPLVGIGMPGHFLVGHRDDGNILLDPFGGGRRLDPASAEAMFHAVHGERIGFDPSYLAPVGPHAITARMLANLAAIYRARGAGRDLSWVERLRALIPSSVEDDGVAELRRRARFN